MTETAGPTILVSHNDTAQAASLQRMLTKHGYRTAEAPGGQRALTMLSEHRPQLLISDAAMPGLNGFDLCRAIKRDKQLADLPVILLGEQLLTQHVHQAMECGADDFIARPFNEAYLLFAIDRVLRSKGQRASGGTVAAAGPSPADESAVEGQELRWLSYESAVQRSRELSKAREALAAANRELEHRLDNVRSELAVATRERLRAEQRQAQLNNGLRLIGKICSGSAAARDARWLLEETCRNAVPYGGLEMAWIGLLDGENRQIKPVAWNGAAAAEYTSGLLLPLDGDATATGPMLQQGRLFSWTSPDPVGDEHWLLHSGSRAVLALPLRVGGAVFAALFCHAAEPGLFDQSMVDLFEAYCRCVSTLIDHAGLQRKQEETLAQLREDESRYRGLVERNPDLFCIVDVGGIIEYASPSAVRILGMAPDRLVGTPLIDRLAGESRRDGAALLMGALNDGRPAQRLISALLPGGSSSTLDVTAVPIVADGVATGVQITARDVTAYKLSQEALKRSEQGMLEAQRIAQMGNWEWNVGTNRLQGSEQFHQIFGLNPLSQEETYQAFLNAIHPEDRERVRQAVSDTVTQKIPFDIEHRVLLPNGDIRTVHEKGEVFCDSHDAPLRLVVTVQDVTERRMIEESLEMIEQNLLDDRWIGQAGTWTMDFRTNDFEWSDSVYELLGTKPAAIDPTLESFTSRCDPDDREALKRALQAAGRDGWSGAVSFRTLPVEGRSRPVRLQWKVTTDPDGRPVLMRGTLQDMAEQARIQDELLRARDVATVGQLVGGVTADVESMLAIITGSAELLQVRLAGQTGLCLLTDKLSSAAQYARTLNGLLVSFAQRRQMPAEQARIHDSMQQVLNIISSPLEGG